MLLTRRHWAYLPDLAGAFVRLASIERPASFDVWHFEGHTLTGQELLDATEATVHEIGLAPARALRRAALPWTLLRVGGVVIPMWRELARMSYLWRTPHALDGHRLAALTGSSLPGTPLSQALRESLQALGRLATGSPAAVALS